MKKLLLLIGFASLTINAQVPTYVPTDGLLGYWAFTGNANDATTYANNGTISGATLTADRFGNVNNAYSFNGSSNFISFPQLFRFHQTGDATISMWINANTPLGNVQSSFLFSKTTTGDQNRFNFYLRVFTGNTANLALRFDYRENTSNLHDLNAFNTFPKNTWKHIVFSRTGNVYSLYIDGVFINTVTDNTPALPSAIGWVIGNDTTSNYDFNGKIDDIGIWNKALNANEILSLYQSEVSCQSLVINSGTLSSYNPPVYQSTVTIYPNPANDQITIDCGNLANVVGYHIEIVNTLGQVVFNQPMNTQQYNVPLNTWSGIGVYFVKIYDASNNLLNTKKIILQ